MQSKLYLHIIYSILHGHTSIIYSGTSNKGQAVSIKDTILSLYMYNNRTNFLASHNDFPTLLVYFQPLRRGHLPNNYKNCWSQSCSLYEGSGVSCILYLDTIHKNTCRKYDVIQKKTQKTNFHG